MASDVLAGGRGTAGASPASPETVPGNATQGSLFAVLVLIWGSTWLAIKIGLEFYPPFFSLALRFGLAGPLFLLIMRLRGEKIPWQWRHQPFFLTIGFLSFMVSYGAVYWSEQYITSGLAAVLFALFPLLTAVFAHYMLHEERLGVAKVAGLIVSLVGIVVINSGDLRQIDPMAPIAALVILLSPTVSALSGILSKQRSRDFSPLAMAGIPMTYGAIAHTIVWLLVERHQPLVWSWPGMASILYLAVFGSLIAFGGYYWLLRLMPVGRLALIAYLTPIVAIVLGIVVAHEHMTVRIAIGAALVLAGVAGAGLGRSRPVRVAG